MAPPLVDPLMGVDRNTRRRLLANEARCRKTGAWGLWQTWAFPRGRVGDGWAADFTTMHRNGAFSVLDRTLADGTRHLAVSSFSDVRPTWWEMQRIKSELAGRDATGIEVYPPDAEVVDEAEVFHLWIVPAGLPFTLADSAAPYTRQARSSDMRPPGPAAAAN